MSWLRRLWCRHRSVTFQGDGGLFTSFTRCERCGQWFAHHGQDRVTVRVSEANALAFMAWSQRSKA